jgi:serine O-acetyltransferase
MQLSISESDLAKYVSRQLNNIFPDNTEILPNSFGSSIQLTIERLDYCFKRVNYNKYRIENESIFNHLYSDQYLMFLWFLSNTVWRETCNEILATKIYYLNKTLHSFDCMYDTELPDIFFISHGLGTVLGKAKYQNFFIAMQGCTIGAINGDYPVLGKGVSLTANSSIIGNCKIGNNVTISSSTSVFKTNIEDGTIVYRDSVTGKLCKKQTENHFINKVFDMTMFSL